MKRSKVLPGILMLIVLSACSGTDGTPLSPVIPPTNHPPGTKTTYLLVEVKAGEDVEEVAADVGGTVLGSVPGTAYYRVSVPGGMNVDAFARRMRGDPRVLHADLDVGMSAPEGDGSTLPAGGLLLASFIPDQEELVRIGAAEARTRATGRGVRIAVLDTGVLSHEFLDGRVDPDGWDLLDDDPDPTEERNGRDDDGDGLRDEGFGHGTFVASLILGVAPDARIVPFRVLDSDAVGNASVLATAIAMAVDRGVDVINLSASSPDRIKVLDDAVASALARGVAVVVSAGNTGGDDVNLPDAIASAFSVTAVDPADVVAPFASFGTEVDLSAPGVELLGAFPSDTGTARWSGTSFSAALATGSFALLRELLPMEPTEQLLLRIQVTAAPTDVVNPAVDGKLGHGRLDAGEATTSP